MSKKKVQTSTPAPRRTNTFAFLLYPEWSNFNQIIAYIQNEKYALILHDMDLKDDETGELKKPHVHCVVRFQGRRTLQSVQNEYKKMGVEGRFIETCNERVMLRYLTHVDDKEKYQYPYEQIDTNDKKWVERAYKENLSASEQLYMILDFIDAQEGKNISNAAMMRYAINNGCYNALRSNGAMLGRCVNEHNRELEIHDKVADALEMERVRSAIASEDALDKTARMVQTFGTGKIEINGKEYIVQELQKKRDDTDNPELFEQIDMLKESRKR